MIHLKHIEQYRRDHPDAITEALMVEVRERADADGVIGSADLGTLIGDHQTAGTIAHLVATDSAYHNEVLPGVQIGGL